MLEEKLKQVCSVKLLEESSGESLNDIVEKDREFALRRGIVVIIEHFISG